MMVPEAVEEEAVPCYFMLLELLMSMVSLMQQVVTVEIVGMAQTVEKEAVVLVEVSFCNHQVLIPMMVQELLMQ